LTLSGRLPTYNFVDIAGVFVRVLLRREREDQERASFLTTCCWQKGLNFSRVGVRSSLLNNIRKLSKYTNVILSVCVRARSVVRILPLTWVARIIIIMEPLILTKQVRCCN
jgi:hypothetical protein